MFDLIVSGGTAVLPTGAETADIGVAGGKIAALGAPGSLAAAGAGRTIDASGQIVMPGGIDPHIHCGMPILGGPSNEETFSAPPETVSRAALHGGTTTLLDFALCPPDAPLQTSIEARQREWAGACYCDYGFHLMLRGKQEPAIFEQMPEAVQQGHASVKIFTTDIRPMNQGRMVRFGDIWETLKVLAKAGGLAAIHAEDNDIVMHMYEKLTREGRTGFENMAEVHNTLSEDLAFNRVIRLASNIEGCSLYMLH
ncbi:MAG TPA: amidohydrolase family protein, partial [Stellaceae bacterium]|nr:amidohydrolase family protein [Stellaceae bacterium]